LSLAVGEPDATQPRKPKTGWDCGMAGDREMSDADWLALQERALAVAAEGVTISDARLPGNPLIYVNHGFELITGYNASEVFGQNCRFLQGPGTDRAVADRIRQAVRCGEQCLVEILNYRKDGTPFWNRLSISPVRDPAGQLTHFIGVQSDVTVRRRAEEDLRATTKTLEAAMAKVKADLAAAGRVQRSLLPLSLPDIPSVRMAWRLEPCEELAGDTLNILQLDSQHLAIYLLDVVGHGIPAALLAFTLSQWLSPMPQKSMLFTRQDDQYVAASPVEVATRLNQQFPFDSRTNQYFTMVYGVLDLVTMQFRYVTAGAPPVIHVPEDRDPVPLEVAGYPIGVVAEPDYTEQAVQLRRGDRLLFVTDGIIEAANPNLGAYGTGRLLRALRGTGDLPLDQSLASLLRQVVDWSQPQRLRDDATMVGIEIGP
jgi:sigma-B regulation protein RsbU (phosphoserine phosphatase)